MSVEEHHEENFQGDAPEGAIVYELVAAVFRIFDSSTNGNVVAIIKVQNCCIPYPRYLIYMKAHCIHAAVI
jgi:hypothetical protein